jgi:hypothetical protein
VSGVCHTDVTYREGPTGAAVVAQIVHWFDSGAVEETFLRLG